MWFFRLLTLAMVCGYAFADYNWNLPKGFPKPPVPADNPMSAAKVELGRYLFYEPRMSVNGKASCATCHKQELAFTDGRALAVGATGARLSRGSMSLVNVAYNGILMWSNPQMKQLEQQAMLPMFGEHPVELGVRETAFLSVLHADRRYTEMFEHAFPDEADRISVANVIKAIASFERSIISASSPYDRYHYGGDDGAISASAKRGETLFFSQPLSCFRCHSGFTFSGNAVTQLHPERELEFHNTGIDNSGLTFAAPTLRNVAVTGPYMHDGSLATLDAVLDHYAAGSKTDPLLGGFALSDQGRSDLLEFLKSLTDDAVLHDARFANPWLEVR